MAEEDGEGGGDGPSSDSKHYVKLPDGGYGWVVTFASFMCHFIVDGMAFTFGVIYPHLLEEFQASKSATSWIGSLFYGVPLICAPVAGVFVNRYGCRVTTICGAVITAVGLFAGSFAGSVEVMSLTYGGITGFGLAFIYVPAAIIPSFWFEKKRSLATGIAVSGSGVGTFVMAPLMDFLMDEYGWRGAVIISSGIALNMVVFGALFRDPPICVRALPPATEQPTPIKRVPSDAAPTDRRNVMEDFDAAPFSLKKMSESRLCASEGYLPTVSMADALPSKPSQMRPPSKDTDADKQQPQPQQVVRPMSGLRLSRLYRSNRSLIPFSGQEVGSLIQLARRRQLASSCPQLSTGSSDADVSDPRKKTRAARFARRLLSLSQELCDVRLFAVPVYLLFFGSNFLLSYALDLPYVYLPDYASDHRITEASFLVSIIGIVNTIGQILYGFLGDNKKIDTVVLYGASILLCGVLVTLTPFMKTYTPLAVTYGLFGLLISANFSLETIVVIKILSLDQLTKAYSLLMFGQGVAALIGPPIGGAFWDLTQTYTYTFVFAGLSMALSAMMVLAINLVKRKEPRSRTVSVSTAVADVEAIE